MIEKNFDIETRQGLPADLRYLAEKYPRELWQEHANIHGMANQWLQRHDMFRELGGMLTTAIGDYREGRNDAPAFARFFAPNRSTSFEPVEQPLPKVKPHAPRMS